MYGLLAFMLVVAMIWILAGVIVAKQVASAVVHRLLEEIYTVF